MDLSKDLSNEISQILSQSWTKRNATSIPTTDNVALGRGMANIEATFLYADLAHSSQLATDFHRNTASKVIKAFLYGMSKLIKQHNGHIVSFDGDRVLGVFIGDSKNTSAAKCALKMKYFVSNILKPKLESHFSSFKETPFEINHGVGIDTGQVSTVRCGIRGENDLVWIGKAPNFAAKLSDIREGKYNSYITKAVFNRLHKSATHGGEPVEKPMWESFTLVFLDKKETVYRSSWWWKP